VEGYNLEDVFTYKMVFREAIWHLISNYNDEQKVDQDLINFNDIRFIEHLIGYSNYLLSYPFLKTRDEIINRRRNQLHQLQSYSANVVSIFQEEELRTSANQAIYDIFGLNGSFLVPYDGKKDLDIESQKRLIGLQISLDFLEIIALEAARRNMAMAIDDNNNRILFHEDMEQNSFKIICIPIHRRNFYLTGLFFIHNQGRVFRFEKFDKNLLYQFSYFTEAVLSNYMMFSELAEKKEELHKLTGQLISIQEGERKIIAAEIHDTITQALTAIGYKALLCQELIDKAPSRMNDELNRLVHDINGALKQSRQMISNLRPKILDDLGIVTAIKRILTDFQEDTNIRVNFITPKELDVRPELGTAFYRILQESLNNIKWHARASKVDISLVTIHKNQLCLIVKDNGQGFDFPEDNQRVKNSGLGILTMRERAQDLGGQLTIVSREGEGCQIIVTARL